jgi:16S rRNA C967 or C1407 C5-methylase (RsmB/RsmF family)/NOL1/NOP2/fmu family ribosome biogenesis protein
MHAKFSSDFIDLLTQALGSEAVPLLEALDGEPPVSVRWNPYKTSCAPGAVSGIPAAEPVPWSKYGRYVAERPSFTLDPWFHAGKYYVQEASSMFVEHIFRSVAEEGVRILDLCAAPGGKSTLYSTLAGPGGLVVANEVIRGRAGVLADNIRKWGLGNAVVTNNDPAHFAPLREWFDIVAVDAPCSGEGMFRKSPESRTEWSAANVRLCAARQRRILADAWATLRPGGTLLYSTCTFNRLENEENIAWLAENFDCADAGIEVPSGWNILQTEASGLRCFRFLPGRVEGEGFFACALSKGGQKGRPANPKPRKQLFADLPKSSLSELRRWVGQPEFMRFAAIGDNIYGYYADTYQDARTVSESLNAIHSGICMGQMFGGKLKPDHSLAMFHDLASTAAPIAELSLHDAIRFLRKETITDLSPLAEGLNMITHLEATLGWAKRVGPRINNLYPGSLAITGRK